MMDINDTLLQNQPNTITNDGTLKVPEFTELVGYGDLSADLIKPTNAN